MTDIDIFNFIFRSKGLLNAKGYTIRVGSSYSNAHGTVVRIRRFYRHESFEEKELDYDYSLAKLTLKLRYTNLIQPIMLADVNTYIAEGTR